MKARSSNSPAAPATSAHEGLLDFAKINDAILAGYEALAAARLSVLAAENLAEKLDSPECDTVRSIAEAGIMVEKRLEEMTSQLSLVQLYLIRTEHDGGASNDHHR